MARSPAGAHAGEVHHGPSTHQSRSTSCCGGREQVVSLTQGDGPVALVELVRCVGCGRNVWRLDGTEVDKARALSALSAAFTSPAPARAPRPVRVHTARPAPKVLAAAVPATVPARELADLLAGWRVLGR
jgi:hypothetical protein